MILVLVVQVKNIKTVVAEDSGDLSYSNESYKRGEQ